MGTLASIARLYSYMSKACMGTRLQLSYMGSNFQVESVIA